MIFEDNTLHIKYLYPNSLKKIEVLQMT